MEYSFVLKHFATLNSNELYDFLKLRQDIFIIEQNCIYQDLDNEDKNCYHLWFTHFGKIIAYCRLIKPGVKYPNCSIGRVIVEKEFRGKKVGRNLMTKAIEVCSELWPGSSISIGAQVQLKTFYTSLGFYAEGDEYNEDGIMHITMHKQI